MAEEEEGGGLGFDDGGAASGVGAMGDICISIRKIDHHGEVSKVWRDLMGGMDPIGVNGGFVMGDFDKILDFRDVLGKVVHQVNSSHFLALDGTVVEQDERRLMRMKFEEKFSGCSCRGTENRRRANGANGADGQIT